MESNSIGNFEVGYINRVTLQDACMEGRVTPWRAIWKTKIPFSEGFILS